MAGAQALMVGTQAFNWTGAQVVDGPVQKHLVGQCASTQWTGAQVCGLAHTGTCSSWSMVRECFLSMRTMTHKYYSSATHVFPIRRTSISISHTSIMDVCPQKSGPLLYTTRAMTDCIRAYFVRCRFHKCESQALLTKVVRSTPAPFVVAERRVRKITAQPWRQKIRRLYR